MGRDGLLNGGDGEEGLLLKLNGLLLKLNGGVEEVDDVKMRGMKKCVIGCL